MSSTNVRGILLLGGACYIAPKVASFLCTRPSNHETRLDFLKERLANLRECTMEIIGAKNWCCIRDLGLQHVWISVLVIGLLIHYKYFRKPETFIEKLEVVAIGSILSNFVWALRYGIAASLCRVHQKRAGQWMDPRSPEFIALMERKSEEPRPSQMRSNDEGISHLTVTEREGVSAGTEAAMYKEIARSLFREPSQAALGNWRKISLLSLQEILPPLHRDPVLSRYVCPITREPIRHPVGDPNGHTLYEKRAILAHLSLNQTSPITRAPLTVSQLVQKPALQALIDSRLDLHDQRLRVYLELEAGTSSQNPSTQ